MMTVLLNKNCSGHQRVTKRESKEHLENRSLEGNGDSRTQIQLEEDGDGNTK